MAIQDPPQVPIQKKVGYVMAKPLDCTDPAVTSAKYTTVSSLRDLRVMASDLRGLSYDLDLDTAVVVVDSEGNTYLELDGARHSLNPTVPGS